MKARRLARAHAIHPYVAGDLLLEADRFASSGPVTLPVLHGPDAYDEPPAKEVVDIIKPKPDDYPALLKTLQVLKFSKEDVKNYHQGIGSLITLTSSVIWTVGAVMSVVSFLDSLLGNDEDAVSTKLNHISQRVDQIYGYLAQQERKGLHTEASAWRDDLTIARRKVQEARASRSPETLSALVRMATTCDENLLAMLNPEKATIAFLRAVYGLKPSPGEGGHWIEGAVSPFMTLANGHPIDYRDPGQELQATIWDAGHYIDVLLQAINDRVLLCAAIEPAFRTTGYGLGSLKDVALKLADFLHKWRSSMIVANPLAGLNEGGELLHPVTDAPPGVIIGAVDPVTGIGFYDMWWSNFTLINKWNWSLEAKGWPDDSFAKETELARAGALDLQPRLLDGVIRASGIHKLVELRSRLMNIVVRSTVGSDFVDLPNATFDRISVSGPEGPSQNLSLGFLGQYSKHPGRVYVGERYSQVFEKRFRFAMPLRGDVSLIQPGYRLQLGSESIVVIPFSNAPADGSRPPRFPTNPISREIRGENWTVYDVYQTHVFSEKDEDRFEDADTASTLGPLGRTQAGGQYGTAVLRSAATFGVRDLSLAYLRPERLFLNERPGYVAFSVDITFDADLTNPDYPFVGHATVKIRNLDRERFRDGLILPVTVYETGINAEGQRLEWTADHMTIHMVPSFLAVEVDYFIDRREALEAVEEIYGNINEKYSRHQPDLLPVGPEWKMRRQYLREEAMVAGLQRFVENEGPAAERVLERFRMPTIRR